MALAIKAQRGEQFDAGRGSERRVCGGRDDKWLRVKQRSGGLQCRSQRWRLVRAVWLREENERNGGDRLDHLREVRRREVDERHGHSFPTSICSVVGKATACARSGSDAGRTRSRIVAHKQSKPKARTGTAIAGFGTHSADCLHIVCA